MVCLRKNMKFSLFNVLKPMTVLSLNSLSTFFINKQAILRKYRDHNPIHRAVRGESKEQLSPNLGWIHYCEFQ
jgi:hypothetical protein